MYVRVIAMLALMVIVPLIDAAAAKRRTGARSSLEYTLQSRAGLASLRGVVNEYIPNCVIRRARTLS